MGDITEREFARQQAEQANRGGRGRGDRRNRRGQRGQQQHENAHSSRRLRLKHLPLPRPERRPEPNAHSSSYQVA